MEHPNHIVSFEHLATVGWPEMRRDPADEYQQIQWLRHCIEIDPHHPQLLQGHPGWLWIILTELTEESAADGGDVP